MAIKVNTKEQLKQAIKNKEELIEIEDGKLAKHVVGVKKIKKISKWALGVLVVGTGAAVVGMALAPETGGTSAVVGIGADAVAYAVAAGSGAVISVEAIYAIGILAVLGTAVLYSIYKDYDVVEMELGDVRVTLKRK